MLREEITAVDSLKTWERTNLKEADPKYNPDANESDDEGPRK